MSILSELTSNKGSTHSKKRIGRGNGSGWGGTAGKGHKGQLARSGGKVRRGFEGGQTPIMRRLPKFGFSNADFELRYNIINVKQLEKLSGEVTPEILRETGLVSRRGPIKILGDGTLSKALTVTAAKFSAGAKKAIEAAGGKVEVKS